MVNIIDRRLNPRDKNLRNREKFVQRSKTQIKKVVKDAIDNGSIADIENGKVRVKIKGIDEPHFQVDPKTGNKKYVMPGNRKYVIGDTEEKEKEGEGEGGKEGGLGRSEDDFEFVLNQDEFLDFIFEDLELPDLIKKQMKDVTKTLPKRSGFTNNGNPSQLDVVRSLKNSIGRRIGLNRPKNDEIEKLEQELEVIDDKDSRIKIIEQIRLLKTRQVSIPWLDPFDIRYRNFVSVPQPMSKAVMFCIMDVSGSMGQREKDLAKRFFFILHLFLIRKYEKVDIVFIRHHEEASEVDEKTFFESKESGGTVVSSALKLTKKIIDERYNVNDWNIYSAQVSDGDNYRSDNQETSSILGALLPLVQYFAYIEIADNNVYYNSGRLSDLWEAYEEIADQVKHFHMKSVKEGQDIWKVFKELFSKERA